MISDGSKILLARQLAGLKRQRWTTLDSVGFIAAALPQGEMRAICDRALQAMRAGAAPVAVTEPLEAALSRGEAAAAETFECLAEALEAQASARVAQQSAAHFARLMVVGPLALATLFAWTRPDFALTLVGQVNLAGEIELAVLNGLRFVGPLAVVGLWALLPRLLRGAAPGGRLLRAAAGLYERSSGDAAGQADLRLNRHEEAYLRWRETTVGPAVAARELAAELAREGRRALGGFERFAPMLAVVAGVALFVLVVSPFILSVMAPTGAWFR